MTRAETSPPGVVISIPCASCDDETPCPDCPRCHGDGMVLVRVAPEHAALPVEKLRELYAR